MAVQIRTEGDKDKAESLVPFAVHGLLPGFKGRMAMSTLPIYKETYQDPYGNFFQITAQNVLGENIQVQVFSPVVSSKTNIEKLLLKVYPVFLIKDSEHYCVFNLQITNTEPLTFELKSISYNITKMVISAEEVIANFKTYTNNFYWGSSTVSSNYDYSLHYYMSEELVPGHPDFPYFGNLNCSVGKLDTTNFNYALYGFINSWGPAGFSIVEPKDYEFDIDANYTNFGATYLCGSQDRIQEYNGSIIKGLSVWRNGTNEETRYIDENTVGSTPDVVGTVFTHCQKYFCALSPTKVARFEVLTYHGAENVALESTSFSQGCPLMTGGNAPYVSNPIVYRVSYQPGYRGSYYFGDLELGQYGVTTRVTSRFAYDNVKIFPCIDNLDEPYYGPIYVLAGPGGSGGELWGLKYDESLQYSEQVYNPRLYLTHYNTVDTDQTFILFGYETGSDVYEDTINRPSEWKEAYSETYGDNYITWGDWVPNIGSQRIQEWTTTIKKFKLFYRVSGGTLNIIDIVDARISREVYTTTMTEPTLINPGTPTAFWQENSELVITNPADTGYLLKNITVYHNNDYFFYSYCVYDGTTFIRRMMGIIDYVNYVDDTTSRCEVEITEDILGIYKDIFVNSTSGAIGTLPSYTEETEV